MRFIRSYFINMIKKLLYSIVLSVVFVNTGICENRSSVAMKREASLKLNGDKIKCILVKPSLEVYSDGSHFSIISRDDRYPAILAYGNGSFIIDSLPPNVRWWFDTVQHSMEQTTQDTNTKRASKSFISVLPLISTKWGQDEPYNKYTPALGEEGKNAPTGCVATAMAQIMNYNTYPEAASFEGSYIVGDDTIKTSVNTTYSWPYQLAYGYYLPDGYTSMDKDVQYMNYTLPDANRIAALHRDCGYAVNMKYSTDASSSNAIDAALAFMNKFSYPDKSVKFYFRDFYGNDEWMDIIYSELEAESPIIYCGASEESGGHAFIIHGIDSEGLTYVNWGWQGMYDGYYSTEMLKPGEDDFTGSQSIVTGIRSTPIDSDSYQSLFATEKPYKFSYRKWNHVLSLSLQTPIFNYTWRDFTGRWAFVIENNKTGTKEYADLIEEGTIVESFFGFDAQTVELGELNFTSEDEGQYKIYMATLDTDETEWQPVRTIGGTIYYVLNVSADGTVSLESTPVYTGINSIINSIKNRNKNTTRYFDLQGREVPSTTKGLLIRKQGDEVKKVMMK